MFNFVYNFLARMGYSHPIHPTEVHMPIGLVTGALVFALVALVFRRETPEISARHCIILAFIWAFPTMLFGFMDWQHFYGGAWLFPIKMKLILAPSLVMLLLLAILLRRNLGPKSKTVIGIYALSFCCAVVLGYFGGQLVYGGKSPEAPQKLKAGREIFDQNCKGCHPQGGNILDPSLPLKKAPQLAEFSSFEDFIRNPHTPQGKKGQMPPFPASKITDQQARELYNYIVQVLK